MLQMHTKHKNEEKTVIGKQYSNNYLVNIQIFRLQP